MRGRLGGVADYEITKGKPRTVSYRGKCAPWIRLQRDPRPYSDCVAKLGRRPVGDPLSIYMLLAPTMLKEEVEVLIAVYLDHQHHLRGLSEIGRGARAAASVELEDVIRIGVIDGASSCVIAHNHPSGKALPSPEDVRFTLKLRDMAREFFGKPWLLDHVIIGYGEFYSFHDNDWREGTKIDKAPVPAGHGIEPPKPTAEETSCPHEPACPCAHRHPPEVPTEVCETVTAAYDSAGYATNKRDPKEVEAARKLGAANTPRRVYDIVAPMLAKEDQEVFLVLPMDLRGQLLSRPVEVARGQRDRVAIDPSDVFRPVIATNAKGFAVVHVHPSGHARPSPADVRLTSELEKATPKALGGEVHFNDHVVVATTGKRGEYYSFRENEGRSPDKGVVHKV
jgi:DNA repair protein RadC